MARDEADILELETPLPSQHLKSTEASNPFTHQPGKHDKAGYSLDGLSPHLFVSPYAGVPRKRRLNCSHHYTPPQRSAKKMKAAQRPKGSSEHSSIIKPLEDPAEQIRLLQVLPGREHRRVRLALSTWSFDTAPPYYAISYTWGDPTLSSVIWIDRNPILVRENCYYAIWQTRMHAPNCHIWIDSICIDQDDVQEKSVQVQRMGNIFSKASHVLVCIGPHAEDSEIIIELAREIDHPEQFFQQAGVDLRNDHNFGIRWKSWVRSRSKESFRRTCKALDALMARSYWTRLWIVQEIALATSITILCGQDILPWATANLMDELPRIAPSKLGVLLDKSTNASGILGPLKSASFGQNIPPEEITSWFRAQKCFDPRDRIYGPTAIVTYMECPDRSSKDTEVISDNVISTIYNIAYRSD